MPGIFSTCIPHAASLFSQGKKMALPLQGLAKKVLYKLEAIVDAAGNMVGFIGPNDRVVYTANDAAGSSTTMVPGSGNLATTVVSAGQQPGSIGNDNVLAILTIPANAFDGQSYPAATNRMATVMAIGSFGATGNNKTLKLVVNPTNPVVGAAVAGGTTIATTGVVATNGGGWQLSAAIIKYGAAGSNTQLAIHFGAQTGATVSALSAPSLLTAAEAAPMTIVVTGNAATAASDVVFNFAEIEWNN
jgi:hypothetical protein